MATRGELITEIRDELQEPTDGLWSNAELRRWLQEANDFVTRQARIDAAPHTGITTVANQESYTLPADVAEIRRVDLKTDTSSWVELARARIDDRIPQPVSGTVVHKGAPSGYHVWNDKLYLTPPPDAAYDLVVWYYRTGNTLAADSDSPIIPAEFHWILKLYVWARAKRKVDDPAYQTYVSDFNAAVSGMKRALRARKQAGRFRQVRDTGQ